MKADKAAHDTLREAALKAADAISATDRNADQVAREARSRPGDGKSPDRRGDDFLAVDLDAKEQGLAWSP